MNKKKNMKLITAIILAAGEGSRIGMPKAVLQINGRYFLERVMDTLILAGFEHIAVVLGAEADRIKELIDLSIVTTIINYDYADGQLSSLRVALDELNLIGDMLIFPVDHPMVKPETIISLTEAALDCDGNSSIIPVCDGHRGHPVYLRKNMAKRILSAPPESTLRDIIWKKPQTVLEVPVEDLGILQDIDTPEDYDELLKRLDEV